MNKSWDKFSSKEYQEFSRKWGQEVLRVMKPGAYLLAFSGTRTYHRMVVGLEEAGLEIKDQIDWIYGSGFPKSKDISKAIDKKPNADKVKEFKKWLGEKIDECDKSNEQINEECEFTAVSYRRFYSNDYWATNLPSEEKWKEMKNVLNLSNEWDWIIENNVEERGYRDEPTGGLHGGSGHTVGKYTGKQLRDNPIDKQAIKWDGWGTALKPSHEPIVLAQKPREGTYAENVLKYGTGALNIDGCRIGTEDRVNKPTGTNGDIYSTIDVDKQKEKRVKGRWPSNLILDEESAQMVDQQSGTSRSPSGKVNRKKGQGLIWNEETAGGLRANPSDWAGYGDEGGASRFFYTSKAHAWERDAGLEDLDKVSAGEMVDREEGSPGIEHPRAGAGRTSGAKNKISTLKPINLMRWLVRLITPPEGTVLDPFAGSCTTGIACIIEGYEYILIEKREKFAEVIGPKRLEYWSDELNWRDLKEHSELPKPMKGEQTDLESFE